MDTPLTLEQLSFLTDLSLRTIRYKVELIQTKSTTYNDSRHSDAKNTDPLRSA